MNMTQIVENKKTLLMLTEDKPVTYVDLIYTLVNQPIKQGITTVEMRRDIRIIDALEAARDKETISLSKEDLKFIAELAPVYAWGVRHVDLLVFEDYITELSK